ncbi:MAG TPA: hypothetical protein PKC43_00065 [Phycisphaerales bacterium]|nr:hypothetical protein [Phycisphaerales bacterium]HMP35818.1 hypothetical protein [Phycisphaerales bacterium]
MSSATTKRSREIPDPAILARAAERAKHGARHEGWLLELTGLPTAAGRETRVIEWVLGWVKRRRARLAAAVDGAGNLLLHQGPALRRRGRLPRQRPLLITAHLDHPAFVVRDVIDRRTLALEFRGGVHDAYFEGAAIEIFDAADRPRRGVVVELDPGARPYKRVRARVASGTAGIDRGDVARWALPDPRIGIGDTGQGRRARLLRAHACDDLAAVAAALALLDRVAGRPGFEHVGVLLTVAEEVGFVGAIAAARSGGLPRDARLICLENSRSFPESPIGGGAILRVGDRISVFSPELTNRLGVLYQDRTKVDAEFRFQRKLMAGGACEATAFTAYGYESTCLCLPLGNYHNMVDIDGVLAGTAPARIGPEFIALDDFHGLVEMLFVAASGLDRDSSETAEAAPPLRVRMEAIYAEHSVVIATFARRSRA